MSNRIKERQSVFLKEFIQLKNKKEKYEYFIKKSKELPNFLLSKSDKIPGCLAESLFRVIRINNVLQIMSQSNSRITQGLMYIIYSIYNDSTSQELGESDKGFFHNIELETTLSITRSYALYFMLEQIYTIGVITHH